MSRRALVVAPTPYYTEKGSTLRVHSMVERLLGEGYHVDVVCYDRGTDPELSGVAVTRAGIRDLTSTDAGPSFSDLLNDVFVAIDVFRKLRFNDYDLLQGEDVEGITIVLAMSRFSDAETVYDLHNPLTENLQIHEIPVPTVVSRAIEGILYRRSDRIITNWNVWADAIRSRYGIDAIETVHDVVPASLSTVALPADRYLAYVGNFNRYQGVDLLIDAFELAASDTDVDLLLVGRPNKDVRAALDVSSVADRIHLVGQHPVDQSNYILANAVANVIPRRSGEQPSTKLIHYAMHEPPIIATDLPCNRELARLDHPVLWAEPSATSIGNRIREVCDDAS